jgi:recombination protein RecA
VEKSGAWYSYGDERIGQGRQNVRRFLVENIDIRDNIAAQIMEKTGLREDREGDSNRQEEQPEE